MFDAIRYELNAIEIDRSRNVEITSLMKGYATFFNEVSYNIHNAEFLDSNDTAKSLMTDDGYFNFCDTAQHVVGLLRRLQTWSSN